MTGGKTFVYYSGWNEADRRGQLLLATGRDSRELLALSTALNCDAVWLLFGDPQEPVSFQVPI